MSTSEQPMSEGRDRWVNVLLIANGIIFISTYVAIGMYNRLSADDFHYMHLTRELGVWDAMVFYYDNWNPRWSGTLLLNALLGSYAPGLTLPLMHIATVALGWYGVSVVLWSLMLRFGTRISPAQFAALPAYLLAALFHISLAKGDTWYWLSSMSMYLWGLLAVVLGFGLLLRERLSPLRQVLVVLLFLFAGGAAETVAVTALIVLLYLGLTGRAGSGRVFHLATVACLIGFCIDALGPGAQVRMGHLPQLPFADRLWEGARNYGRLLFRHIPLMLPALVAFLLPVAWMGRMSEHLQARDFGSLYLPSRHAFAIADLIALGISFMMGVVMSGMGPGRAWLPVSAMVLTIGAIIAFRSGEWLMERTKGRLFHLAVLAQMLLLGLQLWEMKVNVSRAKAYALAVDDRMATIADAVRQGATELELTPLPDAGWLHSAEVTSDPDHHLNQHLSLHFGGKVKVFVSGAVNSRDE
jgi:hypothetical protein